MGSHFRNTGVALILLGLVAIVLPQAVSIILSVFLGSLLVLAGLAVAYGMWNTPRSSGLAWLKPFVLIVIGLLVAFNPDAVAAALGLLLVIYFLFTGFASFGFALDLRPMAGWRWMALSGALSMGLAVVFLVGWPFSSVALVGILVGISFIFEGVSLLVIGRVMTAA